jgi:hypothetical protein
MTHPGYIEFFLDYGGNSRMIFRPTKAMTLEEAESEIRLFLNTLKKTDFYFLPWGSDPSAIISSGGYITLKKREGRGEK